MRNLHALANISKHRSMFAHNVTCTNGGNQYWAGLVASNSLLLTMLSNDNIALLEAAEIATSTTKSATLKRH